MARKNAPQASESVVVPQVVHTEGRELHETDQTRSVKPVVPKEPLNHQGTHQDRQDGPQAVDSWGNVRHDKGLAPSS